jgi:hypothetical protein
MISFLWLSEMRPNFRRILQTLSGANLSELLNIPVFSRSANNGPPIQEPSGGTGSFGVYCMKLHKIDGLAKNRKTPFSVIPAEAGIQSFWGLLDSRLRGSDGLEDFL